MLSFRSARPVLHDLLVFGSFILEPYLHLDIDLKKINQSINKQETIMKNNIVNIWLRFGHVVQSVIKENSKQP